MAKRSKQASNEIEHALEVFVRGFCAEKGRTHPYEFAASAKPGSCDAREESARYRKEEWVAFGVEARDVDAARGRALGDGFRVRFAA